MPDITSPSVKDRPDPDFRALFESAPGLYLVLKPSLEIAAVSDAYLSATMTEREKILGKGLFEVFPDNPDDPGSTGVRNLKASLERVLQELEPDSMPLQKYDIRRPESEGGGFEERFWSPVNSPVLGEDGELRYIIHRVEDVTEFVRIKERGEEQEEAAEELQEQTAKMESEIVLRTHEVARTSRQLKEANVELEKMYQKSMELDRLKSQFFANVSHELRTPLALILGPSEKLLTSSSIDPEAREGLEVVMRNARLLLQQVNDLLDASKLEAGKLDINYAQVDLGQIVRLVAANFESASHDSGVTFTVEADAEVPAQVDVQMIQRVLLNLLSNAFKFTLPGGAIRCSLRTQDAGRRALIEVADSGPGVAEEDRDAIFERFHQLEGGSTRRFGGTGLGLTIARDFVRLHGGSIKVDEAPEGGARFVVDILVEAPEGTDLTDASSQVVEQLVTDWEQPGTARPKSVTVAEDTSGRPLVLVAEDNPQMNEFISESLSASYRVESAPDGREALEKALSLRPDLIVSDVMMPRMSGDELLRECRSHPGLDATPIVMLTAKAEEDLRVRLLQEGANDYLMKPFSVQELMARVGNLISGKLANEKVRQLNQELEESNARLVRSAVELEDANNELRTFNHSMSHDLRAPLRSIRSFSRILLDEQSERLDEDGRDLLQRIASAGGRMDQLITDLLEFSGISIGELSPDRVDLSALAAAAVKDLRGGDPGRSVEVTIEEDLTAYGDERLLGILLSNLIGNAWKYTSSVPSAKIELRSSPDRGKKCFVVQDNGIGFDMDHADLLFQPFQRLSTAGDYPGTGIGLSTVKRIVERHGGSVWAESEKGAGAAFFCQIPQDGNS